ncbi:3'-5' exonuclease [Aureimonas phyllosphaerae]|uniref:3'-5' exonuclease n=1 Tax=Aureimonas phyllosphaerae TaxID=1166078 RepID=UPI003A5C33ED
MQTATASTDQTAQDPICPGTSEGSATARPDVLDRIASSLQESGRYRILRRIEPRRIVVPTNSDSAEGIRTGIVLDTETTGLNHATDEVVEIALIKFRYRGAEILDVIDVFEGLQQPSGPLSPEVSDLTGLSDTMLSGQAIDGEKLSAFLDGVDLVIAHNARFDRPFAERLDPAFSRLAWACSAAEVPWRRLGVEGTKLGYILTRFGLYHEGHRALADCHALLEVLARPPPRGDTTAFAHVLDASRRVTAEVRAVDAPYAVKDVLKARSYRWSNGSDGKERCWSRELPVEDLDDELRYLGREIYGRPVTLPVTFRGAAERHRP